MCLCACVLRTRTHTLHVGCLNVRLGARSWLSSMPTNCVQANDNNLEVLPNIILYLSTRRPQIIGSRGHVRNVFWDSVFPIILFLKTNFFSKNRQKIITTKFAGYGAVPLSLTKMGSKCLSAVVMDNQDRAAVTRGLKSYSKKKWGGCAWFFPILL